MHRASNESQMMDLVGRFREVLETRPGILQSFSKHGVQIEGWLKGELLHFLDNERSSGRLRDFDRETDFGQGRSRIDLKLTDRDGQLTWVELKHWLIGNQKGDRYNAGFYFGDGSSVGIRPDVEKLALTSGQGYILVLATANPGADDWSNGVDRFNRKFSPLRLASLTDPGDYPPYFFLGLLATA